MSTHTETALALIEHAFKTFPERKAFTCLGHTLTYREVDHASAAFAGFLRKVLKLEPGERVALQMPNITQYPIALYGVLRAGLVIVNVNPLYTQRELKHQLNDSGAKALVVLANVAEQVSQVLDETPVKHVVLTEIADFMPWPKKSIINFLVKRVKKMVPDLEFTKPVTTWQQALEKGALVDFNVAPTEPSNLFALQYTGGTTGIAKGAMLTQHNIYSNAEQVKQHLPEFFTSDIEIHAAPLPLYHIYALNLHLFAGVSNGSQIVLIPNPRDLPSLFKALAPHKITVFVGINTLFNAMMHHDQFNQLDFSKLKVTSAGGMALASETARQWEDMTQCNISEGYGLTETSPVVSGNPITAIKLGTIGTPLPKTEIKIIDDDGNSLPQGEPGELCVKGPQVMKGYWQQPDATAEVLDEDGWLKTGDIAVLMDSGYLKIVDRKKDMIIVSGFNVYPNEIEDLAMQHPLVCEAAVIGVPLADGGEQVKIFVVAEDDSLTEKAVIDHCREHLTAYKVPKVVEFKESLPKTNVGKILRRELRA